MKIDEYRLNNIEDVIRKYGSDDSWRNALYESDVIDMISEIKRAWSFIKELSEETASREIRIQTLAYFGKELPHLIVDHGFRHPNRPKPENSEDADEAGD